MNWYDYIESEIKKITPIDKGEDICLSDGIYTKSIKTQLLELKEYYE